jgi:ankyrin repeat protein
VLQNHVFFAPCQHYHRGQTALHFAIQRANEPLPIVRTLLSQRAIDPSPRDQRSNTPLHYAVKRNDIALVQALLDAKADVNAENDALVSPIDLASRHRTTRKIWRLLRGQRQSLVEGPAVCFEKKLGGKPKLPTSDDGKRACKSFQVTATEVYSYGGTDYHWAMPISIEEMIYGSDSLEDILKPVRPKFSKGIKQEVLICRWLHVHENNVSNSTCTSYIQTLC